MSKKSSRAQHALLLTLDHRTLGRATVVWNFLLTVEKLPKKQIIRNNKSQILSDQPSLLFLLP
jgi:hypothetical protein